MDKHTIQRIQASKRKAHRHRTPSKATQKLMEDILKPYPEELSNKLTEIRVEYAKRRVSPRRGGW